MFLLFSAAGAGGALIEERESGTLDRLLSTRLTMSRLLAGKLAYLTSLGFVQLVVMFVWGWLVFGLELPSHLPGFLLMALPTALACSAFGLVLAAVCRTRKQLVAVSNLVILSISALGGSMFPRFLMPEGLKTGRAWWRSTPGRSRASSTSSGARRRSWRCCPRSPCCSPGRRSSSGWRAGWRGAGRVV